MSDKIQKEKEFHNHAFSDKRRSKLDSIYTIVEPSRSFYQSLISSECRGKKVLEYGCGPGSQSYLLASKGAEVTGIDISEVAIEQAVEKAEKEGLKIEFRVANAEELDFRDNEFDLICGSAIIHHLDIEKSFKSVTRVLKLNGECIFFEPLGHNIFINLFRKLTPGLRTEDEHPLTSGELETIKNYFFESKIRHFHLISLFLIPFTRFRFFPGLLSFTEFLDKILFKILPFLKNQAWIVVIHLKRPKKAQN
ncbi:MAG: class I SAM-dependent methyltransferase [Ignavibacteriaceae bacterium]|nr:class I SAM-dependent methyltransferase [Ignavibacteriaceae bacterium]